VVIKLTIESAMD